jgi:hypothetical protein
MVMKRLPSHGSRDGSPPKFHGHDTVQLQLSATVAVSCQLGDCARDGITNTSARTTIAETKRMASLLYSGPDLANR